MSTLDASNRTVLRVFRWLALGLLTVGLLYALQSVRAEELTERDKQFLRIRANLYGGDGAETPPLNDGVAEFIGNDGTLVMTNQPARYRSDTAYQEVSWSFESVIVPRKYRHRHGDYSSAEILAMVRDASKRYSIPAYLILAVIQQESRFDINAVSRCGASGLMQLMPSTGAEMGISDLFDPAQNIAGGTQYLAKMLEVFDYDLKLAVAAYNAGPTVVRRYGDVPPYGETEQYVRAVLDLADRYAREGVVSVELRESARPDSPFTTSEAPAPYTIHFTNGLSQPAESITDDETYYNVTFKGFSGRVRKSTVARIVESA